MLPSRPCPPLGPASTACKPPSALTRATATRGAKTDWAATMAAIFGSLERRGDSRRGPPGAPHAANPSPTPSIACRSRPSWRAPTPPPALLDTPCHPRTPPSSHRTMQALSMRAAVAKPLVSGAWRPPGAPLGTPRPRWAACKRARAPPPPPPPSHLPSLAPASNPNVGWPCRPIQRAPGRTVGPGPARSAPAAWAAGRRRPRQRRPAPPAACRWARPPPRLAPPAAPWRCVPPPAPTGCPAPTSRPTWRTASCPAAVSGRQAGPWEGTVARGNAAVWHVVSSCGYASAVAPLLSLAQHAQPLTCPAEVRRLAVA